MSERRCIFCGSPFTGQATNFEHVIPKWLVDEADLQKRMTSVTLGGRKIEVALNRVGTKVCKKCNDERSHLEAQAKKVYFKITDGSPLSPTDGHVLLDWLDKVRIGMWLWSNSATPKEARFKPKFHINERLARADRIALLLRFPADTIGKGILFYGLDHCFRWAPSAFGMLTNNILMVSASSDFFLLRHLRQVKIMATLLDNDHQTAEVDATTVPQERIHLLGNAMAIGQCILQEDLFADLGVELQTAGIASKMGQSPVMKLTRSLTDAEAGVSLGCVPTAERKVNAELTLHELNLARINQYLIRSYLKVDFSKVADPMHRRGAIWNANSHHMMKTSEIDELARKYWSLTGIRLLNPIQSRTYGTWGQK